MALLFADSFDHYSEAQILRKWSNFNTAGFLTLNPAAGRNGTAGIRQAGLIASDGLGIAVPTNPNRIIVGTAFYTGFLPPSHRSIMGWSDAGILHDFVILRTDGKLELLRGGVVSLGQTTNAVAASQYNYIEVDLTIADTTGAATIRVNGSTWLSLTNVDTRNGASGVITNFWLSGCGPNTGNAFAGIGDFDDFYMLNTSGSTNNSFLGDVRVQAVLPSGAGNYTQWTPLSGANWQNVDENPCTDDTDYNSSSTAAQKDSFVFPDITPSAGTVYAVAVNLMMRKDDAGTRTVRALARLSSTDSFGSDINVGGSYANYQSILETKPGGGSWSVSDVNNSEFGYDLVA
jgi:hypothetical protein